MHESSSSRRVDFDDAVTIEELKRSHPLRSSFLHGDPSRKGARSSTRSHTGTIRRSSSRKSLRPGECPVHGKKVTVIDNIPDVVIPVSISRQNSKAESIGTQPLQSALKGHNGSGVQKRHGWAGLQWALLMGCYALMLLLAVVVGVVLIHQHRQTNPADRESGMLPNQLTEGTSSDLSQGPPREAVLGINKKTSQVLPNHITETKSTPGGPPSRTLRRHPNRPKSLSSQEFSGNDFGSQSSSRHPKVNQAGVPLFPNQQSSQPSLTGPQSIQPHLQGNQGQPSLAGPQSIQPHLQGNQGQSSLSNTQSRGPSIQANQGVHLSLPGIQDRGSSVSQSPRGPSSSLGGQTRGSSFPRQQINQQNNQNRGSSASQSSTVQSSSLGGPAQGSSFPGQQINQQNNQDRGSSVSQSPTGQSSSVGGRTRGSSLPRQEINQQTFSQQNNQDRGSSVSRSPTRQDSLPGGQNRGSSFPRQQTNQQTFPQQNNQNRGSSQSRSPIRPSSASGDQTRSSSFPTSSRQFPNQPSSGNQQRNQPSDPIQRGNQSHHPVQNTRNPSSRHRQSGRPSQPHMDVSELPFSTNPAVQPKLPFEQLHRPSSRGRTNANLPSLDRDFTLAGDSRIPGNNDPEVKIAQLWNHQNSDGSFTYGYVNTDGSFKNETRGIGGCVEGIYGYRDALTNQEVRVPYKTGNSGNNCNVPQPAWPPQAQVG